MLRGFILEPRCKYITILRSMKLKNENSTKIIERLSQFIEYKHDNFNRLSQNIGVSNSYFSKMVRNNGSIGSELLSKIVIYYDDLDINWLITGEGNMLKSSSNISPSGAPVQSSGQTDQSPGTGCQLCIEKDQRIADLQKSIEMWETHFKTLSTNFQSVVQSYMSDKQYLQDQIEILQQQHFDDEEDVTSQAG